MKYRPLPESSLRQFGEWIVTEKWESLKGDISPTEQAALFEKLLMTKLDQFCPEKSMKFSSQDKAWINSELKTISRQKRREYNKKGKTNKYLKLEKLFKEKYKIEAEIPEKKYGWLDADKSRTGLLYIEENGRSTR